MRSSRRPRAQTFRFEIFLQTREKNFARCHINTYAHLHPQFLPGARTNVSFGPYMEARRFLLRPPNVQFVATSWRWTTEQGATEAEGSRPGCYLIPSPDLWHPKRAKPVIKFAGEAKRAPPESPVRGLTAVRWFMRNRKSKINLTSRATRDSRRVA